MFIKNLKTQSKIMLYKKGFKISFTVMLLLSLTCTLYWAKWSIGQDISMVPSASQVFILNSCAPYNSVLGLLYIFVLLLPFSFSYLSDKRNNMLSILQTRCSVKGYYFSKLVTSYIGSFSIFFFPFLISIIINQILFPAEGLLINGFVLNSFNYTASMTGDNIMVDTVGKTLPFINIYIKNPQLYNVLYAFIFANFAGVLGAFVYSLSIFIKKYSIVLLLPLFLITFIQGKLDIIVTAYFKKYINLNMKDYIMIDTFYGLSFIYFIALISVVIIITFLIVLKKAVSDQLD